MPDLVVETAQGRKITPHEWDAVDERFPLPDTSRIGSCRPILITDEVNAVDIVGYDEMRMGEKARAGRGMARTGTAGRL